MRVIAIIVAFALAACATSAPVQSQRGGHGGVSATLDAANAEFSAAYMRGDVEAILEAYTVDALVQTPQGDVISTPEALRAMWAPIAQVREGATHGLTSTFRQFIGRHIVRARQTPFGKIPWGAAVEKYCRPVHPIDAQDSAKFDCGWTAKRPPDRNA